MITLKETREAIARDPKNWCIYLMDFVDDFRFHRDPQATAEPFTLHGDRMDALLASTAESLSDEIGLDIPDWIEHIPACRDPYFVGELENLKAISIVESPLRFRMRKIFVLENFLSRV